MLVAGELFKGNGTGTSTANGNGGKSADINSKWELILGRDS